MKIASITETKNQLSNLLDLVKQGETVLVTDRDEPIARIVPLEKNVETDDAALAALEKKGIIRRSSSKLPPLREKPIKLDGSLLASLLQEREEGR